MGYSRDTCKCDSFWRNPVSGGIPGFSRVTLMGLSPHFNPLLMTTWYPCKWGSPRTNSYCPGAGLKAHKLPEMVAPTEKTDYQICKAGMKAVNGGNCWKHQLQARVYGESKRSVVEPSSDLAKGYKLVFRTHLGLEITDQGFGLLGSCNRSSVPPRPPVDRHPLKTQNNGYQERNNPNYSSYSGRYIGKQSS